MREFRQRILIVDDERLNINVLIGLLKSEHKIMIAKNGEQALRRALSDPPPDLILLDIIMPGMDGYEVCRRLKADERTRDIPVIFVTAMGDVHDETKGLEIGAVDYITKPISPPIVKARVKTHLTLRRAREFLKHQNQILETTVTERTHELALTQDVTILCMASLAETRDNETGYHIRRTQHYVRVLAEQLRHLPKFNAFLTSETIELLFKSAPLHDIGKVGVPDSILQKPSRLTDEETEIMKRHTIFGRDAIQLAETQLGSTSFLRFAREITHSHHEKWDGTGYPRGLKGEAIPISGRLMSLADVYDALISERVYKSALSHEKARKSILAESGTHFDPDMVQAFNEISDTFREIAEEFEGP
ncbi:MAG: two-component system response regulator [Thermoanaerobaculales bacterium]|nr:two-component system response regulator [Thermoanaerobaculales bacterium]